jgi:hypothetical protein
LENELYEKKDRCYRIAKRKYDTFPSAYASGAIVKCRQGKIWKDVNETTNQELQSLADRDQEPRNAWAVQMNKDGGWSEGGFEDFARKRGKTSKDVFDDEAIQKEFMELFPKLDFSNFDEDDWGNFTLVATHMREPQQNTIRQKILRVLINNNREWRSLATDMAREQGLLPDFNGTTLSYPKDVQDGGLIDQALKQKGSSWEDLKDELLSESKKTDFSKEKESGLHGWFSRQGGKGKSQGWVDCNTCRKDKKTGKTKCKSCGREEGEKRDYPACRPTPSACKTKGRGKSWGKKSAMKENKQIKKIIVEEIQKEVFQEGLLYHVKNNIPLNENIYRLGSPCFFNVFKQARQFTKMGLYEIKNHHERFLIEETQIGEWGKFGSVDVPLDFPMDDALHNELLSEALYKGKNVNLGKPQRGGSKKFYVYVKCGDKVKKISFGDPNLSVKVADPERRKSFVARHKCHQKNDRCSAGYWSCRIGRYPHLTGAKQRYSWW